MLTSVHWLNSYLVPPTLTADEAEHVLTHVGFPIESRENVDGSDGDVRVDVELTSNRGDCLCHIGLAREVAAATGRKLALPEVKDASAGSRKASELTSVDNQLTSSGGCPRFTARVIQGVKVGPSPAWLVRRLESVGLRSINNVVDVTNFVNLEYGHPSHVFDLNTLSGKRLIVRDAKAGEKVTALDGRVHTMRGDEMVVADAEKAVSIAGVIGGLETGVTEKTTDVLLEMATWDPVTVRRTARKLDVRTDASHRFERFVDPRDIDIASARAAQLIVELTGGTLLEGMIDEGAPPKPRTVVFMRHERCEQILGIHVATVDIVRLLHSIGIEVSIERHINEERLRCVIPPHRHDLTREIDLIEEVVRLLGIDKVPVAPSLDVHLELSHPETWTRRERAMAVIARTLTGAGYFETVTFSFVTQNEAELFAPPGLRLLNVDEERRKGAPYLRPSIIPSLLTCRRANQDGQSAMPGSVRFFECASVFAEQDDGKAFARATLETRNLALLIDSGPDVPRAEIGQHLMRQLRGTVDALAMNLGGPSVSVEIEATQAFAPAYEGETVAIVKINGRHAGYLTTITGKLLQKWGIEHSLGAAEINLQMLIDLYPPRATVQALPRFPSIERDLSVVVNEDVAWSRFERAISEVNPPLLEDTTFIGSFRGKQIGAGKKSVTLRMKFRDPERTLRHEEVDPQVSAVVAKLGESLGGVLRA